MNDYDKGLEEGTKIGFNDGIREAYKLMLKATEDLLSKLKKD